MADYAISNVPRRVVYAASGTGPYAFTFEILNQTDIAVYKASTLLTLTTDYTVTINANGTGSVTLVTSAGTSNITIVGSKNIQRTTDFTTGGDLFANTLNDELDNQTIFIQQVAETAERGLKAPVTDPTDIAMTLPAKDGRKGKVLAFDSTTGNPVAGPALDSVVTVIEQADNINTVADNIASVNTVAGNTSNINTVAGVSSNVTTVATNIANVNAVGSDLLEPVSEINTVATDIANVNTVGNNISNVNTVAGISGNVTTVAGISANVTTVATNNANVTTVATNIANVNAVAGNNANVTAVAGNATNINAVAGNATNINAVNANSANINTVAGSNTAINTVSTNIVAVNSAYTNLAAIIDAPNQAAAAANSAAQAAASAASGMYSAVQDKSANYTIVAADAGDLIRVTTTSGAVTITLPLIGSTGITDGFKIAIVKWTADANAVNIARSGSNTINGATSAQIGSQYSQIILVADAETSTWFASQSGLGATNINVDTFSGTGSTVAFTLTSDPSTKNNTSVFISGVYQQKNTYSLSGTTLTFSTAPPSGTANIEVAYSTPLAIGTPSDGTVTNAKLADGAVTYAKMQNVTAGKVLGRDTSGSGVIQELPIAVDSSGKVGIGTSSPSGNFDVYSGGNTDVYTRGGGAVRHFIQAGAYNWNISSNYYLTGGLAIVQGGTTQGYFDESGNFRFNSGYGSAATAYGCRAWVNFNGTGTVAIRASGGVSSITDHGTGQYTVNFSITFPDTNYVATGTTNDDGSTANYNVLVSTAGAPATTSCRLITAKTSSNGLYDPLYVYMTFVR